MPSMYNGTNATYDFGTPTAGFAGSFYRLCWSHDSSSLTDFNVQLDGDAEFYVQDLFGLQVRLRQGVREEPIELGTVVDVYDGTGVHDTLDIEVCESYLQSVLPGGSEGGEGGKRTRK